MFIAALVTDGWRAWRSQAGPVAWRLVTLLLTYLSAEILAVLGCLVAWLATGFGLARARLVRMTYTLQRWWANYLWEMVRLTFRLRLQIEGGEFAYPGPILVLSRHASIVDNILPFQVFTRPHHLKLRYVIKKELLVDPALDIAGNWLPNHFIDRGGADTAGELSALRRIATGLTRDDGLVIFPEGTRFTPDKQRRALNILAKRNRRLYGLASALRFLLPPRLGGAVALLEASRADVVVMAHHGLDGFAHLKDIWNGGLVGRTVEIRLTRVAFDRIPESTSDRTEWLFGLWKDMDNWLAALQPEPVTADG
jgi:1-acyl-sn-glycerol-3-phosphate acyltransferase